ncbi:NAD(P)-binding protein [Aaosphaeria arxii CBS 175.79]|uniref:NAD(P)-binding protein n=1 Tax=Aaosphaeria arxii CBS 175.79 TaxID=1450172 RepID=A0A6A5XXH2_9PLEO|nr:NAD(P)-binding protein [Aaosphaeria arxii CBS 175.79]KAF2018035.1 NAD(P)-binding protein [Aaosphaeria arxii CBS 175.79]
MVNIAVAGGTGNVATEILRATIASGRHNITIFTRGSKTAESSQPNVTYKAVDYSDHAALVDALRGFDICLCFMIIIGEGYTAQIKLIDACIEAGVKRFAPSEWGIKNGSPVPDYKPKDETVEYLKEINKDKKVLEYTLFQPSIFMDYFAHPNPLSPNLHTWSFFIDPSSRHAILPESQDDPLVLTRISDDSEILLRAIEDPNPWPVIGGIRGCRTTIRELFALSKEIRGGEWTIENVSDEDVENKTLQTKWCPQMTHPSLPLEVRESYSKVFLNNFLSAILAGSWDVSDEFNQRYPDYKFTNLKDYLKEAWEGKP